MLNNFIYAKQKSLFEEKLNNGEVLNEAIVFIEDTKEIWNHGTYFDCSSVDLSNYNTKEEIAAELVKYAKISAITSLENNKQDIISDLETIRQGAAKGATALQAVPEGYATESYVNTQISNLVDSAPETLNTLNELATAITEHQNVTDALDAAITNKADKTEIPTKISQLENDANYVQDGVDDGVYAVSANGELIDYTTADSTATGVALVAGEHKFMIAKSDATNDGSNTNLYWSNKLYGKDVAGITNISSGEGYIGEGQTYGIDFTTWSTGPVVDFNGAANTAAIIAGYTEHGVSMNARDMCSVLNTFNASDNFKDWYVPACGQLALIYLNKTEINAALAKIGGTALAARDCYWSSSENDSKYAWYVNFDNSYVGAYGSKGDIYGLYLVRFIRDISVPTLKEKVSDLENKVENKVTGDGVMTIKKVTALPSSPDPNTLYVITKTS